MVKKRIQRLTQEQYDRIMAVDIGEIAKLPPLSEEEMNEVRRSINEGNPPCLTDPELDELAHRMLAEQPLQD